MEGFQVVWCFMFEVFNIFQYFIEDYIVEDFDQVVGFIVIFFFYFFLVISCYLIGGQEVDEFFFQFLQFFIMQVVVFYVFVFFVKVKNDSRGSFIVNWDFCKFVVRKIDVLWILLCLILLVELFG